MNETGRIPDVTALMARRLRCPGCMRRFRPQDFATLESEARFGVFRVRCPMCTAQRVIIAVWGSGSVRTYTTDLDAQEWVYYRNMPPIDVDDVIRIARLMAAYEGDLTDVLEDPLFDEPTDIEL